MVQNLLFINRIISKINKAIVVLEQGGLVVFPTETFYGIAVDYRNYYALQRLQNLKKRKKGSPFSLILANIREVNFLAQDVSQQVRDFIANIWPAPLTLVFKAVSNLNPFLVSSNGGIALRLSSHLVASELARRFGYAVTATSANLSGEPSVNYIKRMSLAIIQGVDFILDFGYTIGGLPTTILDVRENPWVVLREGVKFKDLKDQIKKWG